MICINNEKISIGDFWINPQLTIGKEYKILNTRKDEYFILDDCRAEMWIPKWYFK